MAITRTTIFPVDGMSPIVLHNVPQSITIDNIIGDNGEGKVWEDTLRIEDFDATITTLDEYSTGVPHKVVKRVDTFNSSAKTWTEGTQETYEAEEKTFDISYKGHERDFEVKVDKESEKVSIRYRWGMNDSHDLSVEENIEISERPSEGGRASDDFILVDKYYEDDELVEYSKIQKLIGHYLDDGGSSCEFSDYNDYYAKVYAKEELIARYEDRGEDEIAVRNFATEDVEYIWVNNYADSYIEELGLSLEEWLGTAEKS